MAPADDKAEPIIQAWFLTIFLTMPLPVHHDCVVEYTGPLENYNPAAIQDILPCYKPAKE